MQTRKMSENIIFGSDILKRNYIRDTTKFTIYCIILPKTESILASTELKNIGTVLTELNKKNKWLDSILSKNQATVSLWCNNVRQPSIERLFDIAEVTNMNVRKLLVSTKDDD